MFGGGGTGSDAPVTSAAPASCACTAPVSPHTHSSRADRHTEARGGIRAGGEKKKKKKKGLSIPINGLSS